VAVWIAVLLLFPVDQAVRINVSDSRVRGGLEAAVSGARARLMRPDCARVLGDFRDAEGRTLVEKLEAIEQSAGDYLINRVWFVSGDDTTLCRRERTVPAFTVPGHQVVRVCSAPFAALASRQPVAAELVIVHEMLHTLGLGENPPSSREITQQVTKRCGGS
jgi:hypothetical protein